jgi:hypothetical protein
MLLKGIHPGQWKDITIRTHTIGCSVNHSSSKHYPSFKKFLYSVGPGKVRLYDPKHDGEFTDIIKDNEEEIVNEETALEISLSLEKDLQEYISRDLSQLERGLKLVTREGLNSREISTEAGRIDILAEDINNNLVVIELKASKASYGVLGQILSYMASIKAELGVT